MAELRPSFHAAEDCNTVITQIHVHDECQIDLELNAAAKIASHR
jgi:hypothetical protein